MRFRYGAIILLTVVGVAFYWYLGPRTVGTIASSAGDAFVVKQYWNGGLDGFITDLIHTDPQGHISTRTLDADDDRTQQTRLSLDETEHLVHVRLSGDRTLSIRWEPRPWQRNSP